LEEDLAPDDSDDPPLISSGPRKALLEPLSLPIMLGNSLASQSNSSAESDSTDDRRGILLGVAWVVGMLGSLEGETGILDTGTLAPGGDDDDGALAPGDDDDDGALAPGDDDDAGNLGPGDEDDDGTLTPGDDDDDALAPDPPDLVE